jgi:hypothetical protein
MIPPLVPILSQMHTVHTFPNYYPKIHSNIIVRFMRMSSEWCLSFRLFDQKFVSISQLSCVLHAQPISPSFIWLP